VTVRAGHDHGIHDWTGKAGDAKCSEKGYLQRPKGEFCEDARVRAVALECKHEIVTDIRTYSEIKYFYVKNPAIFTRKYDTKWRETWKECLKSLLSVPASMKSLPIRSRIIVETRWVGREP